MIPLLVLQDGQAQRIPPTTHCCVVRHEQVVPDVQALKIVEAGSIAKQQHMTLVAAVQFILGASIEAFEALPSWLPCGVGHHCLPIGRGT